MQDFTIRTSTFTALDQGKVGSLMSHSNRAIADHLATIDQRLRYVESKLDGSPIQEFQASVSSRTAQEVLDAAVAWQRAAETNGVDNVDRLVKATIAYSMAENKTGANQ